MHSTKSSPAQPNPRKRASLACNGCRAKRTKCDGRQPQCSACSYRQQGCEYTKEESNRRRPSNAYITALEARVATLEKKLALQNKPSRDMSCVREEEDHCCSCGREAAHATSDNNTSKTADANSHAHSDPDSSDMDDLADALGCFTLGDTGELRFFGAASNFTVVQNHSLKIPSSVEAKARGIAAARALPGYWEPDDELRDHLLALFWKWQNTWQYIVPRETFVRDLYVEQSGRHYTPLLLNAMIALASRYSDRLELRTDADNANTAGETLAAQARTMLNYESEAPTTSTAQATALLGLYWAATDNEGLGFMYIGMASRMAMNLGLHSDCSSYAAKGWVSEEDVEVRNITFWGIYVLDKLYCLGMGRPASIQEYNITTTKPKAQSRLMHHLTPHQADISSPWPTSHITENVLYFCELLLATSEVIDQLYAQRFAWAEREREDRVMEAHLHAAKLFNRLPKSLKISNSSLQPSPPYVYQLHLQYHQSILLLHRPFFQLLYPGKHSIAYDPRGRDVHSRSCRDSAVKISRILQIYKNNYSHRYIQISAVHPVFTASIVHLLHIKSEVAAAATTESPKTDATAASSSRPSEAFRCLMICVRSLYEMNTNWEWANRSIRAIHTLAGQWGIDLWAHGLRDEIADANWQQFERYERGCMTVGWAGAEEGAGRGRAGVADAGGLPADTDSQIYAAEAMGDIFEAWTYDQGLMQLPFASFDGL